MMVSALPREGGRAEGTLTWTDGRTDGRGRGRGGRSILLPSPFLTIPKGGRWTGLWTPYSLGLWVSQRICAWGWDGSALEFVKRRESERLRRHFKFKTTLAPADAGPTIEQLGDANGGN